MNVLFFFHHHAASRRHFEVCQLNLCAEIIDCGQLGLISLVATVDQQRILVPDQTIFDWNQRHCVIEAMRSVASIDDQIIVELSLGLIACVTKTNKQFSLCGGDGFLELQQEVVFVAR